MVKSVPVTNVRKVTCKGRSTPVGFIPAGTGKDGYGRKIATCWEVQHEKCGNRWYKVWVCCFSNVAHYYTSQSMSGVESAINAWQCQQQRSK